MFSSKSSSAAATFLLSFVRSFVRPDEGSTHRLQQEEEEEEEGLHKKDGQIHLDVYAVVHSGKFTSISAFSPLFWDAFC